MASEDKDATRMIVSVPFGGENASRAAEAFRRRGFAVDAVMDIIGSLVVSGSEAEVRAAAEAIEGVTAVEPEQELRTQ